MNYVKHPANQPVWTERNVADSEYRPSANGQSSYPTRYHIILNAFLDLRCPSYWKLQTPFVAMEFHYNFITANYYSTFIDIWIITRSVLLNIIFKNVIVLKWNMQLTYYLFVQTNLLVCPIEYSLWKHTFQNFNQKE